MAAQIAVAVVGHRARQDRATRLARTAGARLFLDNGALGEWANHRRAWQWLSGRPEPWSLVLQDDAEPVPGLMDHLAAGIGSVPDPGLVSLYLGTGYPARWQRRIRHLLAGSGHTPWARCPELLHGVAVMAPTAWAASMVAPPRADRPYDEQLSRWAADHHVPVFYTLPSLVDHADVGTLVDHDGGPRKLPRKAHRVGIPKWADPAVARLN